MADRLESVRKLAADLKIELTHRKLMAYRWAGRNVENPLTALDMAALILGKQLPCG